MRNSVVYSIAFHVTVGLALAVGLPAFDEPAKLSAQPIPVELVRFDKDTSAPQGAEPKPEEKRKWDSDRSTTKAPIARSPDQGDKGRAEKTTPRSKPAETQPEPKPEPKTAEREPARTEPDRVAVPDKTPPPPREKVETAPKTRPDPGPKAEEKQVARATPQTETETPPEKKAAPDRETEKAPEETEPPKRVANRPRPKPPAPERVARRAEPQPEREPEQRPESRETRKRGDMKSMDSVFKTVKEMKRSTRDEDDRERTRRREPVGRETAPKSAPLTISELAAVRQQIQPCWNFPAGARDPQTLVVRVTLHLRPDGSLVRAEVKDSGRASADGYFRAAVEAALRAVRNPRCSPLELPRAKYDQWKTLTVEFDPAKLRAG